MRTAPTYSEFVEFGFTDSEEQFKGNILAAKGYVDRIVGANPVDAEAEPAYKLAICITVGKLAEYGADASPSFSIGGFSMSGGSEGFTGFDAARRPVLDVLVPAGLAFMGV